MLSLLVFHATGTFQHVDQRTCHSISPQATDSWCNLNCNHDPPNCPASLCSCGPPSPTPPSPTPPGPTPPAPKGSAMIGGYIGLYAANGLKGLQALAANAATIPMTRVTLAFASPNLIYTAGSKTLISAGLGIPTTAADAGFANVSAAIALLKAGGVETFLSMGGWDGNCWPFMYMRHSVAGYGTATPSYWQVAAYGGPSNCTVANEYCFVCEPRSQKEGLDSFNIFAEPSKSATWQAATKYVNDNAGSVTPVWHPDIVPGSTYTDPLSGIASIVPGSGAFSKQGTDPYTDVVQLASELGCAGVDLDYEEFWHADSFKTVDPSGTAANGPWLLHQTVFKYAAIAKDIMNAITKIDPTMKLSTAASAAGAWSGKWWGGNLKGLWLEVNTQFPAIVDFMTKGANAGGLNVMTYDLSDNPTFHECPTDSACSLSQQVDFYMKTYAALPQSFVGYEVGTPAYPNPKHDPTHQLPLTTAMLSAIGSTTQAQFSGGFFWEMFKPVAAGQASPTDTAQAICNAVMPAGTARCKGVIPAI